MGDSRVSLTHHFLIAMPSMADPHFAHTLIYICEHNENGALGIVINKPIDMTLSALFEQINVPLGDSELREARVHYGGPVQIDRGFVLHRPLGSWQSTLAINDDLGLTTSKDILEAVGSGEGPNDVLVSLGYAGWSADQLEQEGYSVERRWRHLIVGTASKEEAEALAARLHGEVEPGGELIWETVPGNPFAIFGGLVYKVMTQGTGTFLDLNAQPVNPKLAIKQFSK